MNSDIVKKKYQDVIGANNNSKLPKLNLKYLYAGDLPEEVGYENFVGLSLWQDNENHYKQDLREPISLPENSVEIFLSEDVFQCIEISYLHNILAEIYRILKPGGLLRISLPDYRCDVLSSRTIKNKNGEFIWDIGDGGTKESPNHLWFPTSELVSSILKKSPFEEIRFLHYYKNDKQFFLNPIDYSLGKIRRTPDFDSRVQNPRRPLSMVIDLVKKAKDKIQDFVYEEAPFLREIDSRGGPKFMQIHTIYSNYSRQLYQTHNSLFKRSFRDQINEFLKDAIAAVHMYAPYMQNHGYESHLILADVPESQAMWLKENEETLENPDNWIFEIVKKQVEKIRPDVLYIANAVTFDDSFLKTLNYRPKIILGWRAAAIPQNSKFSEFDLILSHLSSCRKKLESQGAKKTRCFFPGFPTFIYKELQNVKKEYDLIFTGQWTPEHLKRNEYLISVAEFAEARGLNAAFFLEVSDPKILPKTVQKYYLPAVWGMEMHKVIAKAKIVLNAEIDLAMGQAGNMRLFETVGTGSFLLTEYHDNISEFFQVGEEIESFSTVNELKEKIIFYLVHEEQREEIAFKGRMRCHSVFDIQSRVAELENIIHEELLERDASFEQIRGKQESTLGINHEKNKIIAKSLITQANYALEKDFLDRAFELLYSSKKFKIPLEGTDYLRAIIFIKKNMYADAKEALNEELRFFPNNKLAISLLGKLKASHPEVFHGKIDDDEFQKIYVKIQAYTMMPEIRLYNLFRLAKAVCQNNIPGNFVECGVAGGGSSAMLSWVIRNYSQVPRIHYGFDSFEGMPVPTQEDTHDNIFAEETGWGTGTCAAPVESVDRICRDMGVRDIFKPIKGYFCDTLPRSKTEVGTIAILHMDGDWYESTKDILVNLYDSVSPNGLIQVDDYGHWSGCKKAIHEYENNKNIKFNLQPIDGAGVWFSKT